jgi:transcriptional regulator with XRE-family HTH domain
MFVLTIDDMAAGSFAERLEEVMRERGITAAALATAIGVSPAAISLLLSRDSKSMKPENLYAAADFLGVEARWLAIGQGDKYPATGSLPADLLEVLKKHLT